MLQAYSQTRLPLKSVAYFPTWLSVKNAFDPLSTKKDQQENIKERLNQDLKYVKFVKALVIHFMLLSQLNSVIILLSETLCRC